MVVCALIQADNAAAQNKWKTGYVVNTGGDTLRGKIAYRQRSRSLRSVLFIKDEDSTRTRYTPTELRSLKIQLPFQGLYFKSFVTDINVSPDNLAELTNTPTAKFLKHSFFAQLLVSGKKSLYTYTDTVFNKKHFLIEYPENKLTDLVYKRYYLDNGKTIVMYNTEYIKQLGKFYSDCPSLIKEINDAQFTAPSLMQLAKAYNQCNQSDTGNRYEFKPEKTKAFFGVDLGADKTTLHAAGAFHDGMKFNSSYNFNAGLFLNIVLPFTRNQWSIYNELMFAQYKMQSSTYQPFSFETAHADVQMSYVKLVTGISYQYPYHQVKPFINAGMVNGIAVSATATEYLHDAGTTDPNTTQPLTGVKRYEQSYFVGAGITYKKYGAELRYEHGDGFAGSGCVSTSTSYILFLLKYSFL